MKVLLSPLNPDFKSVFAYARVKRIWDRYGQAVIKSLECASGLQFISGVKVRVGLNDDPALWNGFSGHDGKLAIRILMPSASFLHYNELTVWLLAHELGHRLLDQHQIGFNLKTMQSESEWDYYEHKLLFLFLQPALAQALTEYFYESLIKNIVSYGYSTPSYPLAKAWNWANKLSPLVRANLINKLFAPASTVNFTGSTGQSSAYQLLVDTA